MPKKQPLPPIMPMTPAVPERPAGIMSEIKSTDAPRRDKPKPMKRNKGRRK